MMPKPSFLLTGLAVILLLSMRSDLGDLTGQLQAGRAPVAGSRLFSNREALAEKNSSKKGAVDMVLKDSSRAHDGRAVSEDRPASSTSTFVNGIKNLPNADRSSYIWYYTVNGVAILINLNDEQAVRSAESGAAAGRHRWALYRLVLHHPISTNVFNLQMDSGDQLDIEDDFMDDETTDETSEESTAVEQPSTPSDFDHLQDVPPSGEAGFPAEQSQ